MVLQSLGSAGPLSKQWLMIVFEKNTTKDYCRETLYWANKCFLCSHSQPSHIHHNKRKQRSHVGKHICSLLQLLWLQNYVIYIKSTFATHAKQLDSWISSRWVVHLQGHGVSTMVYFLYTHHIALQFWEFEKKEKEILLGKTSNVLCCLHKPQLTDFIFF